MRTYVRVDPPCRPRRVLRVGRAARRPAAARPAGHRRRRCRARGELRGQGARRAHRDGRPTGAAALPARDRRAAADVAPTRGEQGVFAVFDDTTPAGRGDLDRRGVPRRRRARADLRHARSRSRRGCAARCSSEVGLPITVGVARTKFLAKVASGVAKPDGLLVVPGRRRARVPPPAPGRAAVGRRPRDRGEAPTRAGSRPSARSRGSRSRRSSRCSAAHRGGTCTRSRTTAIRGPVQAASAAPLDRLAARARPAAPRRRRRSTRSWSARRPRRRGACAAPIASGGPSSCGCASTTSRARRARTRCRGRPRTPRRSSRRAQALLAAARPLDRASAGLTLVGVSVANLDDDRRASSSCRSTTPTWRSTRRSTEVRERFGSKSVTRAVVLGVRSRRWSIDVEDFDD